MGLASLECLAAFGRHSGLPARLVVFVIPSDSLPNSTIMNVGSSHPDGIARGDGLEQPSVDRFLRKANIKLMRPPVRYLDKRVEILLQQLARIGFQVAPLVVVVKLVVVIAGRVEIERSAAISFLVSGRSTARKS
jgi:hypothetical protein